MKSIALVCTVHEVRGLANVPALLAILEHYRPEVLFLEAPVNAVDCYFDPVSGANLEANAVRQYAASNHVELVGVDRDTPGSDFFRNSQYLFERIEGVSVDYCRLIDWHKKCAIDYGFAYLNSEYCSNLWAELYAATLAAVKTIDEPRMTELYELWNTTIELRDQEMMKNILKYCSENSFEKGVFLVGARHRQSIIDNSKEQLGADIRWVFDATAIRTNPGPF